MITLPTGFNAEKDKIHQTSPWLWLWRIEADVTTSARNVFQLVAYDEPVTFGGTTWHPWNMQQSEIVQDGEGNLPTLDLTLDNTTGVMSYYLEQGMGFIDRSATAFLVNRAHLADVPAAQIRFDFQIASAILAQHLTLRLELLNLTDRVAPQDRFNATRCRWVYGSPECGYVLNAVAGYQTCPKDVAACVDRGIDMLTRGLPQLQPGSFGGFIGIPVSR